jgi:RNA polymerase sigma-70 factor (ECF subfamily)
MGKARENENGNAPPDRTKGPSMSTDSIASTQHSLSSAVAHLMPGAKARAERLIGRGLARHLSPESLVQEALARLVRRWRHLPSHSLPRVHGWLVVVMESIVRRRLKEAEKSPQPLDHDPVDTPVDPGAGITEGEVRAALLAAIGRLDERAQEVLRLRHQEDLSHREIAGRLGITEGNCKQIHHRALKTLKVLLRDSAGLGESRR